MRSIVCSGPVRFGRAILVKGATSHKRRTSSPAALLLFVAILSGRSPSLAEATHGSWTHHHLVVWDSSSSSYSAYGNVGASGGMNYGHVRVMVHQGGIGGPILRNRSVDCGPIGATSCSPMSTGQVNWPQQASVAQTKACAYSGTHKLPETSYTQWLYEQCSSHNLLVHEHRKGFSS